MLMSMIAVRAAAYIAVGGILVLAMIGVAAYYRLRSRDKRLPWSETPSHIREMALCFVPDLQAEYVSVSYRGVDDPDKFSISDSTKGRAIRVEIKPRRSPPFVREVEVIYEPGYFGMQDARPVDVAQVPPKVVHAAEQHMESLGFQVAEFQQARRGTILGRKAFELKGLWVESSFELKLYSGGDIAKVEIKIPKTSIGDDSDEGQDRSP